MMIWIDTLKKKIIGDDAGEITDIFEKARIHQLFLVSIGSIPMVFMLSVVTLIQRVYVVSLLSFIASLMFTLIIYLLKRRYNPVYSAIILQVSIFAFIALGLFFEKEMVPTYLMLFFFCASVFTYFLLGKLGGNLFILSSFLLIVFYIFYREPLYLYHQAYDIFHIKMINVSIAAIACGVLAFTLSTFSNVYYGYQLEIQKKNENLKTAWVEARKSLVLQEQFLANTSHEIRTPLHGIQGMLRQLNNHPLAPEKKELVKVLTESSDNLLRIVNDILDISKIKAGKVIYEKNNFDLHSLIQNIRHSVEFRIHEKGLTSEWKIADNVPQFLIGDQHRLNQILLNLVNNAIKFTKTGGISVAIENLPGENGLNHLIFRVRDTGIGITSKNIKKIFNPFMQSDASIARQFGGTGLGLAITKELVEQQGGVIDVTSRVNKGSEFSVSLTFDTGKAIYSKKETSLETNEAQEYNLSGIRVLLVEDNLINQKIAIHDLKRFNTEVHVAEDAQKAYELLKEYTFDIVLMDISIPGINGFQATKAIRKDQNPVVQSIPIIALTASTFLSERKKSLRAGMNDFLGKPYQPVELYNVLKKWTSGELVKSHLTTPYKSNDPSIGILNFTALEERGNGDNEYVEEMLHAYLEMVPVYMEEFQDFFKQVDFAGIEKQSHKITAAFKVFGADQIVDNLRELEQLAKLNSDLDEMSRIYKRTKSLVLDSYKEVETYLKSKTS